MSREWGESQERRGEVNVGWLVRGKERKKQEKGSNCEVFQGRERKMRSPHKSLLGSHLVII